jgi:thiol-disulfide isomerase/thioredoxin
MPTLASSASAWEPYIAEDEKLPDAPEFKDIDDWLNGKALKMADQKGKIVIVHFWTHGCINCIHNYPHYRAWQEKYKGNDEFLMIGVHTPEFDSEKETKRIKEQAEKNKLTFPIAIDNSTSTWKAWNNRYWPCVYLVDGNGKVRTYWEGELGDEGYKKMTAKIDELLKDLPKKK